MKKICKLLIIAVVSVGILTGCSLNPSEAGVEYLQNKDYDNAIASFEKAIEEDINVADAYRGIGMAKWEQQDYAGSLAAFNSALNAGAKEDGTLYNLMGCSALNLQNYTDAITYFEKALEDTEISDDLIKEASYNLILAYEGNGDVDTVKSKLSEYVEKYPDDEAAKKANEFWSTR